jgi:S-(hydroxymethyl)glutathione dehydrogenase/alcohol dehydrogenase
LDIGDIEFGRMFDGGRDSGLSLCQNGALKLDELITRRYRLVEINDAFADMREGRNIRGVIEFPE